MPSPEEILTGLTTITNDWQWLAVVWHGYFAIFILAIALGKRPTRRFAGLLLALPLFSVSVLAWLHSNPFNGGLFAIAAVLLLLAAWKLRDVSVKIGPPLITIAGILLVTFGWVYPHFLDSTAWVQYLYAAPTGLIPCPTLSIVIGVSLILDGLKSKMWCYTLGIIGLFYGIFGAVRLGVWIDLTLVAGAITILYTGLSQTKNQH